MAWRSVAEASSVFAEDPLEAFLHSNLTELFVNRQHHAGEKGVRITQLITGSISVRDVEQLPARQSLQVVAAN